LSLTLVYLVLAAQYESWSDPIAIILVVPTAMIGILTAVALRRFPVDLYTQIGLVLMIALTAKNAILIVEFARQLTEKGMGTVEAAVEATRRRFRPILMTSIAFILGVVPLMTASGAGAASQQSLGTVVFGGMLASTLLAIPFVPVFFIALRNLAGRSVKSDIGDTTETMSSEKIDVLNVTVASSSTFVRALQQYSCYSMGYATVTRPSIAPAILSELATEDI